MSTQFDAPLSRMNIKQRDKFARNVIHTPVTGAPATIKGILNDGVQLEEQAPGTGSIYARLWVLQSVSPSPAEGETITIDTSIYKIVRKEADGGGGIDLLLRFHKEVV